MLHQACTLRFRLLIKTAETIWRAFATGWLRWAGSSRCLRVDPHRSQIPRGFFDEAEGRGIFVEPTPAEAHWQMGQVENNARYLRQIGYRIVEGVDVSQSDFQTMLDELTDAKNSLVQHNGYMPRQWVFGLIPRVPGHMLEENSVLPNFDTEGPFRKIAEMRHKCRMAAIETEANAKIRKSLIGRSRPVRGNYVPGDLVYYWRAGIGVHEAQGQWLGPARVIGVEGGYVWVSHRATAIKCAKEQLRMASPAEREMREMLMRTGGDDPDERSKYGVPRQQDLTTTAATDRVSAAKTTITTTVLIAMSVKSRDQIKNHSNHHDRNNEFEFKKIHQQLMMDGESDLMLWKQVRKR